MITPDMEAWCAHRARRMHEMYRVEGRSAEDVMAHLNTSALAYRLETGVSVDAPIQQRVSVLYGQGCPQMKVLTPEERVILWRETEMWRERARAEFATNQKIYNELKTEGAFAQAAPGQPIPKDMEPEAPKPTKEQP